MSTVILYGRHAVFAALKNKNRKIIRLLVAAENEAEVRKTFGNINFYTASKKEIEKIVPQGAVHQGFALETKPLDPPFLSDFLSECADKPKCRVLILDQVTDPQNIGAIIRSAAAFNVDAVILQDKNAPYESGAMAKAAAGTLELVQILRETNLSRTIEALKKAGFWIVGMDGYAKQKLQDVEKNAKLAIVMGSEGAGMRRLIEESCDILVRLEINKNVESLNVSTAAAVTLYELSKD